MNTSPYSCRSCNDNISYFVRCVECIADLEPVQQIFASEPFSFAAFMRTNQLVKPWVKSKDD